ncbi:diacylglycerol kinase family protein [Alteromonas lipotrueiana]|uniref:diacylglycerol kinase family protein n=1 Tax=Alteromonas lipotrueiana TaxID=2803815 RepID=UPI001C48E69A
MKMVKYYLLGMCLALALVFFIPVVVIQLLLIWIAFSLGTVSFAYIFNYPSLFRKREDGSIPIYIRWLFIPFLLGTGAYNHFARKYDKVPAIQKIDDDLFLACRLGGKDIEQMKQDGVTAILDVTAEFDGLDWTAYKLDLAYLNIPVLDHTSPTEDQLHTAINWIDQQIRGNRKVVVHCALGRGRSVLTMAAYLLARDDTLSVIDALNKIQSIRSTARLNKRQLKSLRKVKQGGRLNLRQSLALIANPVAGGGKWKQEKNEILAQLNPYFQVTVLETTKDVSGTVLAEQAINKGSDILVACGGDGTITEVAHACINSDVILGIIPLGTANALSHAVHGYYSKIVPIGHACEVIVDGRTMTMDTARCNDNLMLMVAAIGFEEQMISSADRSQKNEGGQFAYLRGLWQAMSKNDIVELTVSFDNEEEQVIKTPSFVVANAAPITTALAQGGDEPDMTDGKLDITWLEPSDEADEHFFSMAELVFSDKQSKQQSTRIRHRQVKTIRIDQPQDSHYALDGEIYQSDKLNIEIQPATLKVFSYASVINEKEES